MKKLFSSLIVTLLALFILGTNSASAASFSDVKENAYYYEAVTELSDFGYINGYPDGTFKPGTNLKREHAILLLYRMLELEPPSNYRELAGKFNDVGSNGKYAKEVAAIYQEGIFLGGNGKMGMSDFLTREQMASVLVRTFLLEGTDQVDATAKMKDKNRISPYHKNDVEIIAELGITTGKGDGLFAPKDFVTRAEFATFLYRTLLLIADDPSFEDPVVTDPPISSDPDYHIISDFEKEIFTIVNLERKKAGVGPLKLADDLSKVARIKSGDMLKNDYFDHTSPVYGSPFDMMKQFGINYRAAGENIAFGYQTPQEVMEGWMNSPGHRNNILNPVYTEIGIGVVKGTDYDIYHTQMFIAR